MYPMIISESHHGRMGLRDICRQRRPRGYKTVSLINSAECEIFSANKHKNANNSRHFPYFLAVKFSCLAMLCKKEFASVSNLRFVSRTNFMLS